MLNIILFCNNLDFKNVSAIQLLDKLAFFESSVIQDFFNELEEDANEDIKNITQHLKDIFNFIQGQFNQTFQFNSQVYFYFTFLKFKTKKDNIWLI